jgi:hypothetical protein
MDAIQDREKRIAFGTEWCSAATNEFKFKFIWEGYDKIPVSFSVFKSFPFSHDFNDRESARGS